MLHFLTWLTLHVGVSVYDRVLNAAVGNTLYAKLLFLLGNVLFLYTHLHFPFPFCTLSVSYSVCNRLFDVVYESGYELMAVCVCVH